MPPVRYRQHGPHRKQPVRHCILVWRLCLPDGAGAIRSSSRFAASIEALALSFGSPPVMPFDDIRAMGAPDFYLIAGGYARNEGHYA